MDDQRGIDNQQPQWWSIRLTTTNGLVIANLVVYFLVAGVFEPFQLNVELRHFNHPNFKLWQLLSYMFMHGSLSHLLFNSLALWSFGNQLERDWGSKVFLVFYLLCGIGAALIYRAIESVEFNQIYQQLLNIGLSAPQITTMLDSGSYSPSQLAGVAVASVESLYQLYHSRAVGASGAIYGLLVAFALMHPNYKIILLFIPVPIAAKYFVPILLSIDLLSGVTGFAIFGFNIAHFAHIGGAVVGALLTVFIVKRKRY